MSMATNFMETVKNLKEEMQTLLHALDATKGSIGTLLDSARRTEGSMIDREEQIKQEREEHERAERLKALLESEQDLAAHAGGSDTDEALSEPIAEIVPILSSRKSPLSRSPCVPQSGPSVSRVPARTTGLPRRERTARATGRAARTAIAVPRRTRGVRAATETPAAAP